MTITLFDLDIPYIVEDDINDEGKNFIRIKPDTSNENEAGICLDKDRVKQLIRVLQFIINEI